MFSSPEFPTFVEEFPRLTTLPKFLAGEGEDVIEEPRNWAPRFSVNTALSSFGIWSSGSVLSEPGHDPVGAVLTSLMLLWELPPTLLFMEDPLMRPSREVRLWKNIEIEIDIRKRNQSYGI